MTSHSVKTRKCWFQHNILRSIRTRLAKNGFNAKDVRVFSITLRVDKKAVIKKLETENKELKDRVAQLEVALYGASVDDIADSDDETDDDVTDDETDDETDSDDETEEEDETEEDVALPTPPVAPMEKPKKRSIPTHIRRLVWNQNCGERNGIARCWCCDVTSIGGASGWDCGHIIPVARGGSDDIDNLRPICRGCNGAMGTDNMLEFQRRYFSARHASLF